MRSHLHITSNFHLPEHKYPSVIDVCGTVFITFHLTLISCLQGSPWKSPPSVKSWPCSRWVCKLVHGQHLLDFSKTWMVRCWWSTQRGPKSPQTDVQHKSWGKRAQQSKQGTKYRRMKKHFTNESDWAWQTYFLIRGVCAWANSKSHRCDSTASHYISGCSIEHDA